jgi:hypothetical protein
MPGKRKSAKNDPNVLTPAEEAFCEHYVLHQHQANAYLRAFPASAKWKRNTLDRKASALMATAKVQARLTVLRMKVQAIAEHKFEITAQKVLEEYAAIAFTKSTDFARWGKRTVIRKRKTGRKDEKGEPIYEDIGVEVDFVEFTPSDELTPEQAKAIATPDLSVDKFGNTVLNIKMMDRMRALDKLAKFVGLDDGKLVVEHRGQVAHTHEVKAIEEAADEREALKLFHAARTKSGAWAIE